tara:strand:- start:736 stop:1203 length:468 start_codon:yes stop_codon:yes gene_type:complete
MKYVVISGYFNPIHSGHLDYIESAKELGDYLIVIVNNDSQVELKGSVPFMNEKERARIVSKIKDVDYAYLSYDEDSTVCNSLISMYYLYKDSDDFDGMIFGNGGDRKKGSVSSEEEVCGRLGIELQYNVGGGKTQSSSNLIKDSSKFTKTKIRGL